MTTDATTGLSSDQRSGPRASGDRGKPAIDTRPRTFDRLTRSFHDAAGTIVFGMEDGTVSIFGLVFGVAASAPNSHAVFLAGATGAAAAAVSMMAGTYLDVQSANDQTKVKVAQFRQKVQKDPSGTDQAVRDRLIKGGFTPSDADRVVAIAGRHPDTKAVTLSALELGTTDESPQSPVSQASWMLVTDLLAASVPVLPFAFMSLGVARITSLVVTFLLLVGLGIGRAFVGRRGIVSTVLQTLAIASGAALAGLGIAKLIT